MVTEACLKGPVRVQKHQEDAHKDRKLFKETRKQESGSNSTNYTIKSIGLVWFQ